MAKARATYADRYILAVPKKNLAAYRRMAQKACEVWLDHGAIDYRECVADDVKKGKLTSFPQSVLLEPDETVVFAWIVYESREARDRINEQVMKDPRIAAMEMENMPMDGKRMFWGGFRVLVES